MSSSSSSDSHAGSVPGPDWDSHIGAGSSPDSGDTASGFAGTGSSTAAGSGSVPDAAGVALDTDAGPVGFGPGSTTLLLLVPVLVRYAAKSLGVCRYPPPPKKRLRIAISITSLLSLDL